ncbi:MFS transporter [Cellulosimicrobium sp. XJ-DQ-B-000]|uniref:MFS transporter n=1 Tax=Cellulosimicrobium sp. XJ-DQ-B-000 TaxID=3072182 RepID=UPI00280A251B|nr:MFS transporter [Cellulosimicrobium sp. XJ-DQ-B-000]MDQ8041800.1 MFS transporter [Cellulosimicrobium sp. XJ-DQ-B-000]
MPPPILAGPAPDVRRARVAVAALFLTNGALFANLVPRYPEIKAGLDLGNATYGLAVAAFPAGAITAGLAAAALVRRFGSARVAVAGTVLTAAGLLLAGLAPALPLLVVALFAAGAMDAFTDVAQNAHGLRVQRRYGRSIINGFHALWSVGAVVGGGMAAAAIALGLPLGVHLAITGALFAVVALAALRWCLPGLDGETPDAVAAEAVATPAGAPAGAEPAGAGAALARASRARTAAVLAALVLVAVAGTLVEDAGSTWAAVYLSGSLGAPATLAAAGFVALVGAQFVGRLVGDRLVDRFGQRAVARTGGALVALGTGLALAFPSVPGTIAGFAAAGFGVATLVPAAMQQADELPGLRAGTGLTLVSWLMRLGFLLSPPIVGLVADATSLRTGLLVLPLAGVVVVLLTGVLAPRRATSSPHHPSPHDRTLESQETSA